MDRPKSITSSQWMKIIASMKEKWFTIQLGKFRNETIKLKAYEAYLPGHLRGFSMYMNKKSSAVILYSRRLRSMDSIIEVIKHEFIHLRLDSPKHGKEFKQVCHDCGLDPKKHA